jgi:hypothetical protein
VVVGEGRAGAAVAAASCFRDPPSTRQVKGSDESPSTLRPWNSTVDGEEQGNQAMDDGGVAHAQCVGHEQRDVSRSVSSPATHTPPPTATARRAPLHDADGVV